MQTGLYLRIIELDGLCYSSHREQGRKHVFCRKAVVQEIAGSREGSDQKRAAAPELVLYRRGHPVRILEVSARNPHGVIQYLPHCYKSVGIT
jgi:hypothetical protein